MTSEIIVMNREAIALAADSAVTLGDGEKTWQTANKIFTLSKHHPIGIMIYGSASFMGIPWETIIKLYREKIGPKTFNTIDIHALEFRKFLESHKEFIPQEAQEEYFREVCWNGIIRIKYEIEDEIDDLLETQGEEQDDDDVFIELVYSTIERHHNHLKSSDFLDSCSQTDIKETQIKYRKIIKETIESVFEEVPLKTSHLKKLREIAAGLFFKKYYLDGDYFSGVVIAGFGRNEIFPAYHSLIIQGVINDKLPCVLSTSARVDYNTTAVVSPFAQREMVDTFMQGIDPSYQEMIDSILEEIIEQLPIKVLEIAGVDLDADKKLASRLSKIEKNILDEFKERLTEFRLKNFISSVTSVVAKLPKTELALMAEALVSLTSLKRKVTMQTESVSGPVDVAIITKGDGFIWIKRKHYFKPELNPQFFEKYFMR